MNIKAFTMLSQVTRNFNQPDIKIQSCLLSACLLENVHEYIIAKSKLDQGLKLLEEERHNIENNSLRSIASSLVKLNHNGKASQLLIAANQQQANNMTSSAKIGDLSAEQLNESYAAKAQKALTAGKELYESKHYDQAIESLTQALLLFPTHNGIKLNLLQILLSTYESDNLRDKELKQSKKIILELINIPKNDEEDSRFRKMKKRYQQLVAS